MKSGLQAREGLHLNAYLIIRAIPETVAAHNSIFQRFHKKPRITENAPSAPSN